MRRNGGRSRRWPAAAVASAVVLLSAWPGAAWADSSPAPLDPGTGGVVGTVVVATAPAVAVHDDPACAGAESSTVSGDFSVTITALTGGPLAAVTVRSDTLVVVSAVAMLDDQGSGCADLAAIPPGSYQVTASIGDAAVSTAVVVPAPPDPPATTDPPPAPDPGPVPDPGVVAPPVDPGTPTDPPPATDPPAPDPGSSPPAQTTAPVPAATPGTTKVVTTVDVEPAAALAADHGRPPRSQQDTARTAAGAPRAPARPEPTPSATSAAATTVTAVLDSTKRAGRKVVTLLVSSDRPTAVTIVGFVVLEVVGVALLIAFVVLVVSRAPRRRD